MYGHVSSTGVDTPTFSSLWLEITAVLVSLGLDQAKIDRLDAEYCGEEDYLDALLDWADSEEDIKSQLKDIRQCQTETQQDVEKIHKTQITKPLQIAFLSWKKYIRSRKKHIRLSQKHVRPS